MVGAAAAGVAAIAAAPVVIPAAAVSGAVAGGAAAGGAAAGGAGAVAAAGGVAGAVAAALGPVGWIALGAMEGEEGLTWDCWKPILRDDSKELSRGRILRDVLMDPRVISCELVLNEDAQKIIVENQWMESFVIDFVLVHGELAAHVTPIV